MGHRGSSPRKPGARVLRHPLAWGSMQDAQWPPAGRAKWPLAGSGAGCGARRRLIRRPRPIADGLAVRRRAAALRVVRFALCFGPELILLFLLFGEFALAFLVAVVGCCQGNYFLK